jgi:hypothetical protein
VRHLPHNLHIAFSVLHAASTPGTESLHDCKRSQDMVIGEGRHCKVWKARERKTINYYALKRVDCSTRSRKERVEQEVGSKSSSQPQFAVRSDSPRRSEPSATSWRPHPMGEAQRVERPGLCP